MVKIAPSVLAADFLRLADGIRAVEHAGADRIHLDVMDGRFVPNISFGQPVVKAIRTATSLPLEAHLMILEPERYVAEFAQAGADTIIVHQETSPHLDRTLNFIREQGKRAGVALNPSTPLASLEHVIELLDILLIMTVNPGFGGQRFIEAMLPKLEQTRRMLEARNPNCEIEVDGGVDAHTAPKMVAAGARVLVAGTAVFGHSQGPAVGMQLLKRSLVG